MKPVEEVAFCSFPVLLLASEVVQLAHWHMKTEVVLSSLTRDHLLACVQSSAWGLGHGLITSLATEHLLGQCFLRETLQSACLFYQFCVQGSSTKICVGLFLTEAVEGRKGWQVDGIFVRWGEGKLGVRGKVVLLEEVYLTGTSLKSSLER